MKNIILCGGSGTRLWPLSRRLFPKQFIKFFANRSPFQETLIRNSQICKDYLIITNSEQYFLALAQIEELNLDLTSTFLLEPMGRNTAPAVALASFMVDPEEVLLVSPSDHIIKNLDSYQRAIERGVELAEEGYLVTFGIKPYRPETGYGYIEALREDVLKFKEKPSYEIAKKYIEHNQVSDHERDVFYYWNSGIFCFKAGVYLEELKKYEPEIYETSLRAYKNIVKKGDGIFTVRSEDMLNIPEKSIDYAVMEKSDRIKMVRGDFLWSDLGSFEAIYEFLQKDEKGNVLNEKVVNINSKNNLILSDSRMIATVDVEDLIIVDTVDALLVAKKGSGQKVKEVVSRLKKLDRGLLEAHTKVYRPWGSYEVLLEGPHYKIKKIVVKPGGRLSLQKHLHRSEHWIVVSGTATVTVGDKKFYVRPNESTYIKMGEVHRLENEGKIDLVMIEVQVGEYIEEDDIIRIEDDYGRGEGEKS